MEGDLVPYISLIFLALSLAIFDPLEPRDVHLSPSPVLQPDIMYVDIMGELRESQKLSTLEMKLSLFSGSVPSELPVL